MQSRIVRLVVSTFVLTLGFWGYTTPVHSAVLTTPSFNLDAADSSSLSMSDRYKWKDLISGGTTFAVIDNAETITADAIAGGGGSLAVGGYASGAGVASNLVANSGAYPTGDISVMAWVKFSKFSATWNIVASHWFTDASGSGTTPNNDWHFAVKKSGSAYLLNLYTNTSTESFGTYDFTGKLNQWLLVGWTISGTTLQFYVNGKPDGSPVTGVTRPTNAAALLWIGDRRTNCVDCGMYGYIGKFRIWSSALTANQILNDYKNEGAAMGRGTTTTLSLATTPAVYRTQNTITATVAEAGRVTFYERGKVIPGCNRVVAATTSAICRWKPAIQSAANITASYVPTDAGILSSSGAISVPVSLRTTKR